MQKKIVIILLILSLVGLGIAIYSFLHNQSFASGEFCKISDMFDCDIVNKGPFSKFFGIPVAFIGIVGYMLLVITTALKLKLSSDRGLTIFLVLAAFGGLAFSLYLTYIEAFILETWCLLCLTSQTIILLITIGSVWLWFKERKGKVVTGNVLEETIVIEKSSREF